LSEAQCGAALATRTTSPDYASLHPGYKRNNTVGRAPTSLNVMAQHRHPRSHAPIEY